MLKNVSLFVNFAYNYPHNFIIECWGNNHNSMAKHLQNKFSIAYDRSGSKGVMLDFYSMLDQDNREMLCNWIEANYKG